MIPPAGNTKNVGDKGGKPETGTLEKFFNAVFLGSDVMDNAFTVACEMPGFADGFFRDEAGIEKSCAQEGGNPLGVSHIGFFTGDIFHMPGIYNKERKVLRRGFKDLI